jgi:hypothetical protein
MLVWKPNGSPIEGRDGIFRFAMDHLAYFRIFFPLHGSLFHSKPLNISQ